MSRERIAQTLKKLRIESGMTADEVGRIIGKSGKTVNAWENNRGQPDAEMLIQLCDIYNVDNILKEFSGDQSSSLKLSEHEQNLILAYRDNTDMQLAVDRLLRIEKNSTIKIAARNGSFQERSVADSEGNNIEAVLNQLEDVPDF